MAVKSPDDYPIALIGAYMPIPVQVSFETNGLGNLDIPKLPFRVTPVALKHVVVEDIEGSDAATITLKKGSTSLGVVTIAAGAQIGENDEQTTITEAVFEETDAIRLTLAKSTAGGRGMAMLIVKVLPSH